MINVFALMMFKDWVILGIILLFVVVLVGYGIALIQDEMAWHEWNKENEIRKK